MKRKWIRITTGADELEFVAGPCSIKRTSNISWNWQKKKSNMIKKEIIQLTLLFFVWILVYKNLHPPHPSTEMGGMSRVPRTVNGFECFSLISRRPRGPYIAVLKMLTMIRNIARSYKWHGQSVAGIHLQYTNMRERERERVPYEWSIRSLYSQPNGDNQIHESYHTYSSKIKKKLWTYVVWYDLAFL